MLFAYTYVPHAMEKMQEFIDFIFYEVWCKAPGSGAFRFELLDANAELKELMEAFYYGDTQGGDFFYGHVERIHGLFAPLTPAQINQLRQWYQANNDIEKVCDNDPAVQIARYADIKAIHPDLTGQLASFFKGLYSQKLLDLKALRDKIGEIDEHYKAFMQANKPAKCPFCGITDMLGIYHTKREAYDHYLPKALYPFNSINFRNLVPACHYCNSSYKTTQDPSYSPKDPAGEIARRKSFYPYSTNAHRIEITIDLNTPDIDRLTPADIQLTFGPAAVHEEIETWKEVYGIDERYRGKLLNGDGKAWLVEVFDEWRWKDESTGKEGRNPDEYLRDLNRHTTRSPYTSSNFLKIAFLEGCQRAGLFDVIAMWGATP